MAGCFTTYDGRVQKNGKHHINPIRLGGALPRIVLGDFNGDGKMDVVTGATDETTQVEYGNGDCTFQGGPVMSIGVVSTLRSAGEMVRSAAR